jgi:hypothetical protein
MSSADTVPDVPRCAKPRYDRMKTAATVIDFERARLETISQRQFAQERGVPRSTLQEWVARKDEIDAPPGVVRFAESPDGLEFIHGIVTSAHYHFTQAGPDGLRRLQAFIQCSPLSPFVASSYGSLHKAGRIMEDNIKAFGVEQTAVMAKMMAPKEVSVAEDESFFPRPCLVAIDPVSGFIFLEEYADDRTAKTWDAALKKNIADLPVVIIQSIADQARGLVRHALIGLGVHHSPDLFHVQRELSKAFGPLLRAMIRRAKRGVEDVSKVVDVEITARDEYMSQIDSRGPGRPPKFDAHIEAAKANVVAKKENLAAIEKQQEEVHAEIRGIGLDYHPFDLHSGQARQAADLTTDLEQRFESLRATSDDLDMSEQLRKYIEKAARVVPEMVATIVFFWAMVNKIIAAHAIAKPVEQFIRETLIPLAYLKLVAGKTKKIRRDPILVAIAKLQAAADGVGSPIAALDAKARAAVLAIAQQCAEVFQRSSSCVEGRNGTLSLHHHAGRSLTPRRLNVLNVIHNYGIKRPDGTTAAMRLSGYKHPDLFEWLLARQPNPARPARASRLVAKAS